MEDFLFTIEPTFCNSETGEIIWKTKFSKPLSVLEDEDLNKYFHAFIRAIRAGNKVALTLSVARDRDLPKVVEQKICF